MPIRGVSAYEQIAAAIRERIQSGAYPPGSNLPGLLTLAAEFGTGRDTIIDAVDVLREDGLVLTGRGRRAQVWARPTPEEVEIPEGATVDYRPATRAERIDLGLPVGWGMYLVAGVAYPADRTVLVHKGQSRVG